MMIDLKSMSKGQLIGMIISQQMRLDKLENQVRFFKSTAKKLAGQAAMMAAMGDEFSRDARGLEPILSN